MSIKKSLALGACVVGLMAAAPVKAGPPHISAPAGLEGVILAAEDAALAGAKGFIQRMTDKGIAFLSNPEMSQADRKAAFRDLLRSNFDLTTIGRFTLGKYWKTASKAEQQEYLKLFERSIVESYARRFAEYQGQSVHVKGAAPATGDDTIVTTVLEAPNGGQDVQVDWRVRKSGKSYKIVDVVVEGVSMAVTQRSDFASVIQRGGGGVSVLIDHLRAQG